MHPMPRHQRIAQATARIVIVLTLIALMAVVGAIETAGL